MRRWTLTRLVVALLLTAPAALAAPTCQNLGGDTARCGTPGAMPVGWTPSEEQLIARRAASPPSIAPSQLASLIGVVGGLFALIALMPDFDGRRAEDWDDQEPDDRL